jgi:hypothetical protein
VGDHLGSSWQSCDKGSAPDYLGRYSDKSQVFKSAWENEIIGFDMAAWCVYRACHHCNSGLSQDIEIAVSPDGRFVAFTSDMMGTLGSTDGKEPILGKNCRSDVFVVEVAPCGKLPHESKAEARKLLNS